VPPVGLAGSGRPCSAPHRVDPADELQCRSGEHVAHAILERAHVVAGQEIRVVLISPYPHPQGRSRNCASCGRSQQPTGFCEAFTTGSGLPIHPSRTGCPSASTSPSTATRSSCTDTLWISPTAQTRPSPMIRANFSRDKRSYSPSIRLGQPSMPLLRSCAGGSNRHIRTALAPAGTGTVLVIATAGGISNVASYIAVRTHSRLVSGRPACVSWFRRSLPTTTTPEGWKPDRFRDITLASLRGRIGREPDQAGAGSDGGCGDAGVGRCCARAAWSGGGDIGRTDNARRGDGDDLTVGDDGERCGCGAE
jgi:hypothetical protein